MLVSFTFKNHGPFKNECTFDMRAIPSYKEHPYMVAHPQGREGVLRIASVFGANAAGKSQFVDAYRCFRRLVLLSLIGYEDVMEDNYAPFLFANDTCDAKTEYEGCYADHTGEYQYGFSHSRKRILEEWLYFTSAETRRKVVILEREGGSVRLGASVKKECQKYIEDITEDALVLSFLSRLGLKNTVFAHTSECVKSVLPITSRMCTMSIDHRLRSYFRDDFDAVEKEQLMELLSSVDTGIKDITVKKLGDDVRVLTHHEGADGEDYVAPLEIESAGTRKIIALYSYFRQAIDEDAGLIIDELDAQLHPLLLRYLVNMFKKEGSEGQLIYTGHDTTLLDRRYTRRDQVWIVAKNEAGESELFSLAEFKPRNDARLDTAYLSGIFGGIPRIIDPNDGDAS